jgi:hypothetical protein
MIDEHEETDQESEELSWPWKAAIGIAIIAGIFGVAYVVYLVLVAMGKI